MNIIVCIKQILDTAIPVRLYKVDPTINRVIVQKDFNLIVSDYDRNAMEAALQIKDKEGGKVTVLSLGAKSAFDAIRECIAMGADEGILLNDPAFDDANVFATAYSISQAIKKIGAFDLVLCGRQEGDWDAGQVGTGIATFLDLPFATTAASIESKDGKIEVQRVVSDGRDIVELPLPALVTVSNEIGAPRYPVLKRVMAAKKKEVPVWTVQDIGADPNMIGPAAIRAKIVNLSVPVQEAKCEYVTGETPEQAGANLAMKLKAVKLI
jgi:electron transfer flavoprotein beta subunit